MALEGTSTYSNLRFLHGRFFCVCSIKVLPFWHHVQVFLEKCTTLSFLFLIFKLQMVRKYLLHSYNYFPQIFSIKQQLPSCIIFLSSYFLAPEENNHSEWHSSYVLHAFSQHETSIDYNLYHSN